MRSVEQLSTHHRDYLAGGNEICLHIHKRGQANSREEEIEKEKLKYWCDIFQICCKSLEIHCL